MRKIRHRPNHACLNCRNRKVKCDGIKPSCSNCYKRNQECVYNEITIKLNKPKNGYKKANSESDLFKLRAKIQRIECELISYKHLSKYWFHMANQLNSIEKSNVISWIKPNIQTAKIEQSKSLMIRCLNFFDKKSYMCFPNYKSDWNEDEAYFYWKLILMKDSPQHNFSPAHNDITYNNFVALTCDNTINDLISLLEYALKFLHGAYGLGYRKLEKRFLSASSHIFFVLSFEYDALSLSHCADKIVDCSCWMANYHAENNKISYMNSCLLFSYKLITKHISHISPDVLERFYINMLFATMVSQEEPHWIANMKNLGVQPNHSQVMSLIYDGIFIISGLKKNKELSNEDIKEFIKRIKKAEEILDEWNESKKLFISSLFYRTMLLSLRAEISHRLGLVEERDLWIEQTAKFVLSTEVEMVSKLVKNSLAFLKSNENDPVNEKLSKLLEEKLSKNQNINIKVNE